MTRARLGAVARTAGGGLARRRVQTVVICLVTLISTAACVLALGLVADSNSPFDSAFTAQHGAHLVATVDSAKATPAQLRATERLPEVTLAAGPLPEVTITPELGGGKESQGQFTGPPLTLAGRARPGGPLDNLVLQQGRWPRRPGELVLSSDARFGVTIGGRFSVHGVPGSPVLTVVGIANSVTNSADGWVLPAEIAALRQPGASPAVQMMYRFTSAGSAAAMRSDIAVLSHALPPGALLTTASYLTVRLQDNSGLAPIVPFVVTFGVIGLVLSLLIVINVVSGAVVSGYRRIGILKSIGFTPGQVVAAYTGQVLAPTLFGCLAGVVLGNVASVPLLSRTASVYQVGALVVPAWVDASVPAGLCFLAALAAVAPALRAGQLSAIRAIAIGRAPAPGHGRGAHRLLATVRLPRPVTIGLAAPFARPARTAMTMAAILLGAVTVTFATGLTGSLDRVVNALSHAGAEPVQVYLSSGGGPGGPRPAIQERAIRHALDAQPDTMRYVAEADQDVTVAGISGQVPVTAFRGDARWTGYEMISGRWYTGPAQVDVPTNFLTVSGKAVGDMITISVSGRNIPVRIVGEVFDTNNRGIELLTDWRTLAAVDPHLSPTAYDVGLRPGTDPSRYAASLGSTLGSSYQLSVNSNDPFVLTLIALIALLTVLLAVVAGLGVLNTVVLHSRERVHDLGIFKAVGMTPRQTIAMVICWVAGTGLAAGIVAVPAGMALHRYVLPIMAHAAATNVPASIVNDYTTAELIVLALSGLVIAVAGALLPATWAAASRTATALRAE